MAMVSFGVAAVAAILLSLFLLLMLTIPVEFFRLTAEDNRTMWLVVSSSMGTVIGLFFGFITKPEKILLNNGKEVGWEDLVISISLSVLFGFVFGRFILPPLFALSAIAISRFILGCRYYLASRH
jgi:hypothetical protein